jgi:predicted pyridoxine 5'-phosphate oxidase superfamily flavin-nucleotide-binding protein
LAASAADALAIQGKCITFLMDYPNRRRIKVWGTTEVVEDDPDLLGRVADSEYRGRPEGVFIFHLQAWDVNCPQHIEPRWTQAELAPGLSSLQAPLTALDATDTN